jgi:hypothetical protein
MRFVANRLRIGVAPLVVLALMWAASSAHGRPAFDAPRPAAMPKGGAGTPRSTHEPTYFFSSVAATIKFPGMPVQGEVIRPSTIFLFADGSWALVKLHWTGWGSSVAHAKGISSASNGIPDQAKGKRINTPAQISLSSPGRFFGREVYRCFRLQVQPPATDLHGCLTGHHGYWVLG